MELLSLEISPGACELTPLLLANLVLQPGSQQASPEGDSAPGTPGSGACSSLHPKGLSSSVPCILRIFSVLLPCSKNLTAVGKGAPFPPEMRKGVNGDTAGLGTWTQVWPYQAPGLHLHLCCSSNWVTTPGERGLPWPCQWSHIVQSMVTNVCGSSPSPHGLLSLELPSAWTLAGTPALHF